MALNLYRSLAKSSRRSSKRAGVSLEFDEFADGVYRHVLRSLDAAAAAELVFVPGDTEREWQLGDARAMLVLLRRTEGMIATASAGNPKATLPVFFDEAGISEAAKTIAAHLLSARQP